MAKQVIRWKPDWDECIINYAYDNSLPSDQIVFTGDSIEKACPIHQSITDPDELYKTLHRETVLKERTRDAIIQLLPDALNQIDAISGTKSQDPEKFRINFSFEGSDPKNRNVKALFKAMGITLNTQQKNFIKNNIKTRLLSDALADNNKISIFDEDDPNTRLN